MATSPSYGDRPPLQGFRRSFTVPSRTLSLHEKAGLDRSDADANILYSHPSARIIAFSPPAPEDSSKPQGKDLMPDTDYPVDTIETLPWRARTETLAAAGPFIIEKVRGSSNFLKSADQKVIHTIMRNSQCWCVDGESKFVMRIGKLRYYRIELPSETEEDKARVEELKAVLSKVLRFERTPCPFKRAFHVDLPDDAITPRRKGQWKRQPSLPTTPNTDPLPLRRTKGSRAWSLQGQNASTLQRYGRRGSDYGYSPSRASSPLTPSEGGAYRSGTPSSIASSEDASDRRRGRFGEDQDESSGREDDERSVNESEQGSVIISDVPDIETIQASELEAVVDLQPEVLRPGPEQPVDASTLSQPSELSPDKTLVEPRHTENPESSHETADEPIQEETVVEDSTKTLAEQEHEDESVQENDLSSGEIENELDSAPAPSEEAVQAQSASATCIPDFESRPPDSHTEEFDSQPEEFASPDLGVDEVERFAGHDKALSRVSSVDSFHTTNSLTQESLADYVDRVSFETTPQGEKMDPFSMRIHQHRRGLSELTVTASTVDERLDPGMDLRPSTSDSLEKPSTPALARSSASDSSWPEICTPSSPTTEGVRRRLNVKRSLSPLPPSPILFSPSNANQGNHFTAAILQKACNVALVKPIEAVVLLVHILARIAGGATVNDLLNGDLFRRPEQHRRSSSFPDQASSPRDDSDDEDDFGVPLRGRSRSEDFRVTSTPAVDDDGDSTFDLD